MAASRCCTRPCCSTCYPYPHARHLAFLGSLLLAPRWWYCGNVWKAYYLIALCGVTRGGLHSRCAATAPASAAGTCRGNCGEMHIAPDILASVPLCVDACVAHAGQNKPLCAQAHGLRATARASACWSWWRHGCLMAPSRAGTLGALVVSSLMDMLHRNG